MQGHWIGGTRKLNRHWQGENTDEISRVFTLNLSINVLYPQLNNSHQLSEIPWTEIIGLIPGGIGYDYNIPENFSNVPRIDFYFKNKSDIPFYITPRIPSNNSFVSEWLHRFVTYERNDGESYTGENVQNFTTKQTTSYTSSCMYYTLNGYQFEDKTLTGFKIEPNEEINITSFLPFFADDTHFLRGIVNTFGIDITEDDRYTPGSTQDPTPRGTYKREDPIDLQFRVKIYRNNQVI